jgi:hypothetical protein
VGDVKLCKEMAAEECVEFLSRFTDESGKVSCTRMREEFDRLRNENTDLRHQVQDWKDWLAGACV